VLATDSAQIAEYQQHSPRGRCVEATFSNTALSGEITPAPVLPSLEAIAKSSRTFGRADVDKTGSP
jgi:hypothetical protein